MHHKVHDDLGMKPADRRLDRRTALPLMGMEAQVAIRDCRTRIAPLYEAALASRNHAVLAEAKALAATLQTALLQAKRLTGYADGLACPDDLWGAGHGRAA